MRFKYLYRCTQTVKMYTTFSEKVCLLPYIFRSFDYSFKLTHSESIVQKEPKQNAFFMICSTLLGNFHSITKAYN